jgi:murein DD-endopeptidase MepM/ murein hydrolase activator NlpD
MQSSHRSLVVTVSLVLGLVGLGPSTAQASHWSRAWSGTPDDIPAGIWPQAPEPSYPSPKPAPAGVSWPTSGRITQYFSASHPAIDIANNQGTSIVAAQAGRVTVAGWNSYALGYYLEIDHGNGFVTGYAHLASAPAVGVGQSVGQGQYVGAMGATGQAFGPHLHFSLRENGGYVNPLTYLP